MQVKASKQSFNLNTKIYNALYVKSNKYTEYSTHLFNEDELNDICGDTKNTEVDNSKKKMLFLLKRRSRFKI